MTIQPVERKPDPKYPDKYAGDIRRVLAAAQPGRWLAAPLVVGVLASTVALGLGGCGEPITLGGIKTAPAGVVESANMPIPLFEYGEGTGTIGCASITAPVFLSEEEAFAILGAAFAEAGIVLQEGAPTLAKARLPVTELDGRRETRKTKKGDLTPDGMLSPVNLPMAFVSTDDVKSWRKGENFSTVSALRTKQAARLLADNNPGLVVFYDPMAQEDLDALWRRMEREPDEGDEAYSARMDAVREQYALDTRAESERLLRQQARAFVEWMHAAG